VSFSSIFEVSRADLAAEAAPQRAPTPEALTSAEIRRHLPGQPIRYGIDGKGPYAQVGDVLARARPDCAAALRAALGQARKVAA
jgi:hypothetical protein